VGFGVIAEVFLFVLIDYF